MTNEEKAAMKVRREAYKGLITPHKSRDLRMQILEVQGEMIGWKRPTNTVQTVIPTFPFIFAWSDEQRYEIRPCRWAGNRLAVWQPHRPNVGRPVFVDIKDSHSPFHIVRQRRAVKEDLCAMCGDPVDTSGVVWVSVEDNPVFHSDGWSSLRFPHLHLDCIRHAITGCPFMRAGFGGFAPYRGPIRKQTLAFKSGELAEVFGLRAHAEALTVGHVLYQVPAEQMRKLQALAREGSPDGLHWRTG